MALYTVRAFAEAINVNAGTVKRWVHEGMPVLRGGRRISVDSDAAMKWINEHRAGSCAFARESVVYAIRGTKTGRIKIGFSSDVDRRRKEIRRDLRERVEVLVTFQGTKRTEVVLHALLKPWAVGDELYAPIPALLDFIDRVKGTAA